MNYLFLLEECYAKKMNQMDLVESNELNEQMTIEEMELIETIWVQNYRDVR
jgi:hypothetical protein